MSDQSRLCDKHGEVVLFFGNNGPDDPGECPWCEVSRLREEKEASWNSAEHNARRAEAAEAEVARWRAEAMAARRLLYETGRAVFSREGEMEMDAERDYATARAANGEDK